MYGMTSLAHYHAPSSPKMNSNQIGNEVSLEQYFVGVGELV